MFVLTLLAVLEIAPRQSEQATAPTHQIETLDHDLEYNGVVLKWLSKHDKRCLFGTLVKLRGCVKDLKYNLHRIPDMQEVRKSWLAERVFSSPGKVEELKERLNERFAAAYREKIEELKQTVEYKDRLNKDVMAKVRRIIAESITSDVKKSEEKIAEVKMYVENFVDNQMFLFAQEFKTLAQRWRDSINSSPTTGFISGNAFTTPPITSPSPYLSHFPFSNSQFLYSSATPPFLYPGINQYQTLNFAKWQLGEHDLQYTSQTYPPQGSKFPNHYFSKFPNRNGWWSLKQNLGGGHYDPMGPMHWSGPPVSGRFGGNFDPMHNAIPWSGVQ